MIKSIYIIVISPQYVFEICAAEFLMRCHHIFQNHPLIPTDDTNGTIEEIIKMNRDNTVMVTGPMITTTITFSLTTFYL